MPETNAAMGSDKLRAGGMPTAGALNTDAQRRRIHAARRRVLVLGASLGAVAILLIGLMAWQRDTLRMERTKSFAVRYAHSLQAFTGPDSPWPTTFPILGLTQLDSEVAAAMKYLGPKSTLRTGDGHQVLAYSDPVISFIHAPGRAIIVADGRKLRVKWVSESQFEQMDGGTQPRPRASRSEP
jgi:hypothetical protein